MQLKRQPDPVQATCSSEDNIGSGEQTAHADVSSSLQPTSVCVPLSAQTACHSCRAGSSCGHATAVPVSGCQQQPALPNAANTQHAHVKQRGTDVGSLVGSEHTSSYASYASDAAHKQYTYFKFSRQQRHAAAVIIQQHARGVFARHLVKQLQKLRLHAERRQQHVLALAMVSWREHAAMRCSLRYSLYKLETVHSLSGSFSQSYLRICQVLKARKCHFPVSLSQQCHMVT